MKVNDIFRIVCRIVVGLVFIFAGILKSFDPIGFSIQIDSYGIVGYPLSAVFAYIFIAVEIVLGLGLVIYFLPRVVIPSLAFLTLIFMIFTVWGWAQGRAEGCGCFGALFLRTPQEVIVEDVILLIGLGISWRSSGRSVHVHDLWKRFVLIFGCIVSLALLVFGYYLPVDSFITQLKPGTDLRELAVMNIHEDLSTGTYLIIIVDNECITCTEAVHRLNSLMDNEKMPQVLGIFAGNREDSLAFFWDNLPRFTLGYAPLEAIRIYYRKLPRTFLLHDGIVQKVWDGGIPSFKQVSESIDMQ